MSDDDLSMGDAIFESQVQREVLSLMAREEAKICDTVGHGFDPAATSCSTSPK